MMVVIVVVVIVYVKDWNERKKDLVTLATEAGLRLALAGVVSLLSFRLTQPMSFRAETGNTTLLTLHLNPEWTASLAASSDENSGIGAGPPGEQWTNRPAIVFPWLNMVIWGMG